MPRARRSPAEEVKRLIKAGWTLATNADRAAGKIVTWRPPQPEFRYATLRQRDAIAIANKSHTFKDLGIDPMDISESLVKYCEICGIRYLKKSKQQHECDSLLKEEQE